MAQGNGTSEKSKKLISSANRVVSTKTLFLILFLIVVAIVGMISKNVYFSKIEEYKDNIYLKVNQNIIDKYDVMLHEKMNTSILVSSSLSKNANIKKAFHSNNATILNMSKLLDEMKTSKEYVDIQAELIDRDGISFKRSWTHFSGDDLVKNDPDMAHLVKYPRVDTDIKATKYGLTISNKIPIYDNDEFLGLFGVNIHFDALVDIFMKQGFDSIILLNKNDSKKIFQDLSYSKKFVGDCYVVNSNANDYLVKIIKNNIGEYCDKPWEKEFMINEATDHLVSNYAIKDSKGQIIARAIIFKPIEQIDFEDLEFLKKAHVVATFIFVILLAFFISYLYMRRSVKELKIENEELIHVNDDLKTKTDEMDFNDKKLDNMFNMQPNLMIMHNGREITKANKRFMGFFNRFGTFDGFRKKHKCVSELFEKYEAPNYIWDQKIENEFWIEYMLKNPRRLYKTVMSINGDPHHFIIKFNEMEYAQHVTERVIIIALVDMTQDLVNYKTLDESSKVLDMLGNKLELKEEKGNTDISYELQEQIAGTLSKLTNKEIVEKEIIRTNTQGLKGQNIIKVQGTLKFSDVESDWMFFIPTVTASKVLNTMMGTPDEKMEANVTKDNLDTSREFISIVSTKLCDEINKKGFHDLKDARYSESTIHEATREDINELSNIYKIRIKLEDGFEVEFFTTFLDDIVPFLDQMANEKEIKLPTRKEQTQEEPKEEKVKDEQTSIDDLVASVQNEKQEEKKEFKKDQTSIDDLVANLQNDKKDEPKVEEKKIEEKTEQELIDDLVSNLKEEKKPEQKEEITDDSSAITQDDIEKQIKENDKNIVEPELKEEKSTEINEEIKEKEQVKTIKPKIKPKPVKVSPDMVKKSQKTASKDNKSNKIDANTLIQENFIETLNSLVQNKVTSVKFSPISATKLEGGNFIQTDNKFVIASQNKELKWGMLIPSESLSKLFNLKLNDKDGEILSKLDEDLKNLAKDIIKNVSKNVSLNTSNKIELNSSDIIIKDDIKFDKEMKLYNIGIRVDDENLPIYIFI